MCYEGGEGSRTASLKALRHGLSRDGKLAKLLIEKSLDDDADEGI